eukprot:TRINITY_DN5944_c0_g1_i10.p1 TRINITY_DN5944_c0_g1~~TRINITY_DN5944_c0_g1_i10.p1  ORF type:complete len:644 (-),score=112.51 TRINITY_DN5944_c0_g1_i10:192-2123(-)
MDAHPRESGGLFAIPGATADVVSLQADGLPRLGDVVASPAHSTSSSDQDLALWEDARGAHGRDLLPTPGPPANCRQEEVLASAAEGTSVGTEATPVRHGRWRRPGSTGPRADVAREGEGLGVVENLPPTQLDTQHTETFELEADGLPRVSDVLRSPSSAGAEPYTVESFSFLERCWGGGGVGQDDDVHIPGDEDSSVGGPSSTLTPPVAPPPFAVPPISFAGGVGAPPAYDPHDIAARMWHEKQNLRDRDQVFHRPHGLPFVARPGAPIERPPPYGDDTQQGAHGGTRPKVPRLDMSVVKQQQQQMLELQEQQLKQQQQQTQQQQREAQQQQEQQRHQNQHQRSYRGRSRHGFSPLVGRRRSSGARLRRNSQQRFRDREQTFIVLDWDNTLFPTTYRAQAKDCDPAKIAECQRKAVKLVSLAACLGKVIIVTLGDYEWLARCFAKYYIDFGMLVERLRIPILYARTDEDKELTYVDMKQQAIAGEIAAYYSAYNGQSWKNVISIGDSDYERVATWRATSDYVAELREKAGQPLPLVSTSSPCTLGAAESNSNSMEVDVDGHFHKVRCKTLKLVERPSADDLALELEHMLHWMPLIVGADSSLDLAVSDVRNISELKSIWETLHSVRRASSVSSFLERVSARTR